MYGAFLALGIGLALACMDGFAFRVRIWGCMSTSSESGIALYLYYTWRSRMNNDMTITHTTSICRFTFSPQVRPTVVVAFNR
jgi:hypothetical protein